MIDIMIFFKKGKFSEYKIIDSINGFTNSTANLPDHFAILSTLPHKILYSDEFRFLVQNGVDIEGSELISTLILNKESNNYNAFNYLLKNIDSIKDKIYSYLLQKASDSLKLDLFTNRVLGQRLLQLLLNVEDDQFIYCAHINWKANGFSSEVNGLLAEWVRNENINFSELLTDPKIRLFLFDFYKYICRHDHLDLLLDIRSKLISPFCFYVFDDFRQYLLKNKLRQNEMSKKDWGVYLGYIEERINYFDLQSAIAILDEIECEDLSVLLKILIKITKFSANAYSNQTNQMLDILNRCDYLSKKDKKVSILDLINTLPEYQNALNFFSEVFSNSFIGVDTWYFRYLVYLHTDIYIETYSDLIKFCLANPNLQKNSSSMLYPLINEGHLDTTNGNNSYSFLFNIAESTDKILATFQIWLDFGVFSDELFRLILQIQDIAGNDSFVNICNRVFKQWWFTDKQLYGISHFTNEQFYYKENKKRALLEISEYQYYFTDESILQRFRKWKEYKEYIKLFNREDSILNSSEIIIRFLTFVNTLDDNGEVKFYYIDPQKFGLKIELQTNPISLPQVLFMLSYPEVSRDILLFFSILFAEYYKNENIRNASLERIVELMKNH